MKINFQAGQATNLADFLNSDNKCGMKTNNVVELYISSRDSIF